MIMIMIIAKCVIDYNRLRLQSITITIDYDYNRNQTQPRYNGDTVLLQTAILQCYTVIHVIRLSTQLKLVATVTD